MTRVPPEAVAAFATSTDPRECEPRDLAADLIEARVQVRGWLAFLSQFPHNADCRVVIAEMRAWLKDRPAP
jgi:hypothetical protein